MPKSSRVRLEDIADSDNLREAFLRAALGKASRADVVAFRANLTASLAALRTDILAGTAPVGNFRSFRIFEPKERVIHAPCFVERVLHHALLARCEPDFERRLTPDVYACRRGMGRERAIRAAAEGARRHEWFLKLDVSKYFDSIPHGLLIANVTRCFRDKRVGALWARIIEAYDVVGAGCGRLASEPLERSAQQAALTGLPIGALTSQHLANGYLAPVDRLVRGTLRIPAYARYMDDMLLWADDKAVLKTARREVEVLLGRLGLALNRKWHLQPARCGVDFLGYRVRPDGVVLARASRRRLLRRYAQVERFLEIGLEDELRAGERVRAMLAFARAAAGEKLPRQLFGAE